ncbi:hypothetical protein FB45DRAFT_900379 [Roridomyces roridus]|uniref:Mid2 domain-containing protein n=1 Tax=Roridomyces roridus TaxID=1738132 RepID=A0AAD7FT50_9AGAR|nr:hypothetical protein FB45DRAFT_900379 [Roridomyces roridus]
MLLILSTLLFGGVVAAQSTNATCDKSFDWSLNSRGQSPCLVAAYLGSVCSSDGLFIVPALPPNSIAYQGPILALANPCACSSVFYSLLGACADCQSTMAQVTTWSFFNTNCSTSYLQTFNQNIPSTTAVPHWAYQDVTAQTDGKFNVTLAQLQVNGPESTSNPQPTTTNLPSVSASASPRKKSHAGAIAGGVVGGVVFVVISIAAFWFIRRRQRDAAPSSSAPGEITPSRSTTQMPKLYDPSDPSTFPPSLSSGRVQSPAYSANTLSSEQPRVQYTGAPQV